MLAFTNTEVSRDQLIASLEAHRAADRIARGFSYWTGNGDGRGCAVGCTLHDFRKGSESDHALYEPLFGVPRAIARLEDCIFEGLPVEEAPDWPLRFTRAIREGADLSRVTPGFLYRLVERRKGALREGSQKERISAAMDQVLAVLAGWRETGVRPYDAGGELQAARRAYYHASAAYDAAAAAASSAASAAYAAYAAYASAASAASAAAAAAASAASAAYAAYASASAAYDAAAASAAASDAYARHDEYRWMADVLIEEIEKASVLV